MAGLDGAVAFAFLNGDLVKCLMYLPATLLTLDRGEFTAIALQKAEDNRCIETRGSYVEQYTFEFSLE